MQTNNLAPSIYNFIIDYIIPMLFRGSSKV